MESGIYLNTAGMDGKWEPIEEHIELKRAAIYTGPIGTALHRSNPCWRIAILLKWVPRGDKNPGGYRAQKCSPKTANVAQNTPTTLWDKCKLFS